MKEVESTATAEAEAEAHRHSQRHDDVHMKQPKAHGRSQRHRHGGGRVRQKQQHTSVKLAALMTQGRVEARDDANNQPSLHAQHHKGSAQGLEEKVHRQRRTQILQRFRSEFIDNRDAGRLSREWSKVADDASMTRDEVQTHRHKQAGRDYMQKFWRSQSSQAVIRHQWPAAEKPTLAEIMHQVCLFRVFDALTTLTRQATTDLHSQQCSFPCVRLAVSCVLMKAVVLEAMKQPSFWPLVSFLRPPPHAHTPPPRWLLSTAAKLIGSFSLSLIHI